MNFQARQQCLRPKLSPATSGVRGFSLRGIIRANMKYLQHLGICFFLFVSSIVSNALGLFHFHQQPTVGSSPGTVTTSHLVGTTTQSTKAKNNLNSSNYFSYFEGNQLAPPLDADPESFILFPGSAGGEDQQYWAKGRNNVYDNGQMQAQRGAKRISCALVQFRSP